VVLGDCPGFTTLTNNGLLLKTDGQCMCYWSRFSDKALVHSICDGRYSGWPWEEIKSAA